MNIRTEKRDDNTKFENTVPISAHLLLDPPYLGLKLGIHAAVLKLAFTAWAKESSDLAYAAAGKRIKRQSKNENAHLRGEEWQGAYGMEKEGTIGGRIRRVGRRGNKTERNRLLVQGGPDHPIKITCTPYALLRAIKASDSTKNLNQVVPILEALTKPVNGKPPLLLGFKVADRLELSVNHDYVHGKTNQYVRVPVPLPLGRDNIMRGYLLCHYFHSSNYKHLRSSTIDFLMVKFGISSEQYPKESKANRAFDRAFADINKWLRSVGAEYRFDLKPDHKLNMVSVVKLTRGLDHIKVRDDDDMEGRIQVEQAAKEAEVQKKSYADRTAVQERVVRETRAENRSLRNKNKLLNKQLRAVRGEDGGDYETQKVDFWND